MTYRHGLQSTTAVDILLLLIFTSTGKKHRQAEKTEMLNPPVPTPYISAPHHFFKRWRAVTKTATVSCINEARSCNVLVWDTSGRISVYTTKGMWSHGSLTTSTSCLSDQMTGPLGGLSLLY